MAKLPSFQFYPGDWLKDANLARCSPGARGFYMDVLCTMFDCEERGVLISGGKPWTLSEITSNLRGNRTQNRRFLDELLTKNVLKRRPDSAVFSARMVRDDTERKQVNERVKRFRNANETRHETALKRRSSSSSSSSTSKTLAHAVVVEVPDPQTAGASPSPSEVQKAIGKGAKQLHPNSSKGGGLRAHLEAGIFRKKTEAAYFDATNANMTPGGCIQEALNATALSLCGNRSVELKGLDHGELAIAAWAKISPAAGTLQAVRSFEIRSKQVVAVAVRCVTEAAMEFLAKGNETHD